MKIPIMRKALVVGQHFARKTDEGAEAVSSVVPGVELEIVHDDANEYDHYAASVRLGGVQVGYISGDVSPVLCLVINNGATLTATVIDTDINRQGNCTVSIEAEVSS